MSQLSKRGKEIVLEYRINPFTLEEGFTQSEMQMLDDCPERWYRTYNQLLKLKGQFSWALAYGSWIHASLEEWYASKGKRMTWDPTIHQKDLGMLGRAILEKREYYEQLGAVQTDVYTSQYRNEFKILTPVMTERVIDIEWEGIRLKGMIDLVMESKKGKGGLWVYDHKTTGKIDKTVITGWDFRFQFLFYVWLLKKSGILGKEKIQGFVPNALKKPQIRQGVHQSLDEFMQRVRLDMLDRPEMYFYREELILRKDTLDHFEANILRPKINRIKTAIDPDTPPEIKSFLLRNKNTNHCLHFNTQCPFLPLCQHGDSIEAFRYGKRKAKHEELEEESAE